MDIKEMDFFKGMSQEFMDEMAKILVKESYDEGDIVFKQGDPAHNFYLLEEGEVKLSIGEEGHISFDITPGDSFGWFSLIDFDYYSATAECKCPSKLIKIEKDRANKLLEKYPASGLAFFKGMSGFMGERLIKTYTQLLSAYKGKEQPSYG